MKKILLSLICALISVGAAWTQGGVAWTVTFPHANDNNGSAYTTSTALSTVCQTGADNFSAISSTTNVASGMYGLKIGQNKNSGSITFNISSAAQILPSKIEIEISANKNPANMVFSINDVSQEALAATNTNDSYKTYTLNNFTAPISTLSFSCTKGASPASSAQGFIYINKITVYASSDPTKKDAALSFPQAEYNATIGEAFTKPELTKATTAAVEYTSSNAKVATVDAATGEVTLVHWGETTITAAAPAEGDFNAGSASYTLKVTDPNANDGSLEKPYTVEEAIMLQTTTENVYIKGIVVSSSAYSTDYNNVDFFIGDTKSAETAGQLKVFRGVWGTDIANKPADNTPEADATVIVCGKLTVYNGAPQVAQGGVIEQYIAPIHPLGDICTWSWGEGNTGTLTAGAEKVTVEVLNGVTITFTCENATKMTYTPGGMTGNTPGSADGSSIEYVVTGGKPNFKLTAEGVDENGNAVTKDFNVYLDAQVLSVGDVSATLPDGTAIEANGSYTITEGQAITVSAENAVKYQISYDGQAAADMEGNSYTFNAVGENISVVFYAIGSDTSQKEIAFTLTVAEKPVEDVLNVDAFDITTTYKTYTYNSTASKVEYAAYAYNSSGMQINSKKGSSGIVSTANPESRAIKQIVITVYGGAGTLIVKAGNEANSLTGTGADAAINLAENATELTAAVDGKVYTYTPSNCTFFAVTSSGVVQITSINVTYGAPNSGTVTGIEGVEAVDANAPVEYYNLQGVRVAEPTPGLYIRRQGGKISKVIVK